MKFSEMKPKQLREARNDLQQRLQNTLRPTRISGLTDNTVFIEGGIFPATYDHRTGDLSVWGRGSRYSGGSMTRAEIEEAEFECQKFFNDYKEEK